MELSVAPTQAPLDTVPCSKKAGEKDTAADRVKLSVFPGDIDRVLHDVCDKLESVLCVKEIVAVTEPDGVENIRGEVVPPANEDGEVVSLFITLRDGETVFEKVTKNGDVV